MNRSRTWLGLLVVLGAMLVDVSPALGDVCARAVQGQVAWYQAGDRNWNPVNIARLCAGAEHNRDPAECFHLYTDPGFERGAGEPWTWTEGVELCAGTRDHVATLNCFSERIRRGLLRAEAIDSCRWASAGAPASEGTAPLLVPSLGTLSRTLPVGFAGATWHRSRVAMSDGTHLVRVAARPPLGEVAGLMRFQMRFAGRDHKIRRIAVLSRDRFAEFALGDSDGEDRFSGTADWAVFSSGRPGVATASGGGRIDLALESGPPGTTLVLTGFEFQRLGSGDANVRSIGVRLAPQAAVAHVWLIDDQGFDIRNLESIGWSAIGGLILPPIGHVIAGAASAPAASPGNMRPYSVTVQYAWIPDSLVAGLGSASGTGHLNTDRWRPEGPLALQGFEFAFGNSDHHLHGIGVTLGDHPHHVMFRDQGIDDPMQWAVSYAILDTSRER